MKPLFTEITGKNVHSIFSDKQRSVALLVIRAGRD